MKLSKFLLVGAALCYGTSAIAQTVLPTAPTPPAIVTTSPLRYFTSANVRVSAGGSLGK